MPRYIDAELLIDKLEEKMRTAEEPYQLTDGERNFNFGLELATEIAFNMPTADVVEVVRCKDCRHLEILNGKEYYARCKWHNRLFASFGKADTRTWFCADGERRDDDEK